MTFEWHFGPLHPPSLAKSLPTSGKVVPLTSETHPAWKNDQNAKSLESLFDNGFVQLSEKRKNNQ